MDRALIRDIPLFASLSAAELEQLAATLRQTRFAPGALLFREGELGDRFCIVLSGQIEVIKALGTEDEKVLAVRGPGEIVGEMSLINPDRLRTASVRADTEVEALEFSRDEFTALLAHYPSLTYEILTIMSVRLKDSHDQSLKDLHEKNRQLTLAYNELKAAQAQIIEKEKLERELEIARQVQAGLIPREMPPLAGWDFAAWWQPARLVGGDFYDFIPVSPTRAAPSHGLVMADVSDHGIGAALFMVLTRSVLRASMAAARTPAEGIGQANRLISADAARGLFVTLFYGQLSWDDGELVYVNAGHNPPLHYQAEKAELTELRRTGFALGIDESSEFSQRRLKLLKGDLLLLYTDGATEATDARGEEFGEARLRALLCERHARSAAEIVTDLEAALRRHVGSVPLADDITVLVVKRE